MVTLFTVFDRWQSGFISFVKKKLLFIIDFDYIILEKIYIPKKKKIK